MTVIAHRCGPHAGAAENSVDAARRSLELGADFVELDIRYSRDGVPVVAHDPDLPANPQPFSAFTAAGVGPLLVDFKAGDERVGYFIATLAAARYLDRVVFGVRSRAALDAARRLHPRLGTLAFMEAPADACPFLDAGADIIRLWESWADARAVEAVHAAGRAVWVMMGSPTADRVGLAARTDLERVVAFGVDGVLLDDVALGVEVARGGASRAPGSRP